MYLNKEQLESVNDTILNIVAKINKMAKSGSYSPNMFADMTETIKTLSELQDDKQFNF